MSEEKIKVSELPENEQKELSSLAYSLGLRGNFSGWNVATLKAKIEDLQANANKNGEAQTEGQKAEGEQKAEEQNGETVEQEANETQETELNNAGQNEETKEVEKVFNGICHICRSKVYNGVCSGCGFKRA